MPVLNLLKLNPVRGPERADTSIRILVEEAIHLVSILLAHLGSIEIEMMTSVKLLDSIEQFCRVVSVLKSDLYAIEGSLCHDFVSWSELLTSEQSGIILERRVNVALLMSMVGGHSRLHRERASEEYGTGADELN